MLDSIDRAARRTLIGGSDARIIMGKDAKALLQLWREKRGEAEPENFDDNLVVQLGNATEDLNVRWFMKNHPLSTIGDRQSTPLYRKHPFVGCTLDGLVYVANGHSTECEAPSAVFEGKFMLPWHFDEAAAREKHYWQCQHNMMVTGMPKAFLSIITGGGQYVCCEIESSAMDQALLLDAEKAFWQCVLDGTEPRVQGAPPPPSKAPPAKIYNMRKSNIWADDAAKWLRTKVAHGEHEDAKKALKDLVPADAKEARGAGIVAKRSKAGAVTIEAHQEEEEIVDA